jgi:thioredoxin-like negative regulator of GroEL
MDIVNSETKFKGFKNTVVNEGKPTFAFFSMKGCLHCDNTKEPWKKLKKTMKGSGIKFVEVDSEFSERGANMLKNSSPIQAFPTLLAIKGGAVINEFAGERTHEGLTNFVKQNFSKGGRRRKTRKQRRKRRRSHRTRKSRRRKTRRRRRRRRRRKN